MTEIVTVAGLDARRLEWVSALYGRADPKYRDRAFVEHLFLRNPIGPSLHAFAVDGERAVGHCCVVRTAAYFGSAALAAGKLEALYLEESHRRRDGGGTSVVRRLLDELYAFSDAHGIELVHALATARIGPVIRFEAVTDVGERTFVSVLRGDGVAAAVVAAAQAALRGAAAPARRDGTLRRPAAEDRDLVDVPPPPPGRWAIVGGDAWAWYCESPLVRVLELGDSRALVQLPSGPHEPLRIVGWRTSGRPVPSAVRVVAAAARLARARGAATLRFQPWHGAAGNGALARACRLLGLVRRADLTTVWVRATRAELSQPHAPVSTPFLYLGF